ncbi:hypothetical protein BW686_01915, partial [Pseudomonas syringae]
KQIAGWLARNEQKLLAHPELRANEPTPLAKKEAEILAPKESKRQKPIDKEDELPPPNRNPLLGVLEDSVFAQKISKPTKAFSKEGQNIYSQAAGQPIKTVADLTSALKKGIIKPSQVPLDYVSIDGHNVIANTRSSTALINAGIPKSQWYGANKTGVIAYDSITFDDLVRDQLRKNYGGSALNARR